MRAILKIVGGTEYEIESKVTFSEFVNSINNRDVRFVQVEDGTKAINVDNIHSIDKIE